MYNKFSVITVTKEEMLESLSAIEDSLTGDVAKAIASIISLTKDKHQLKPILEARHLVYEDDSAFFEDINRAVANYVTIIPSFRTAIINEIPNTTTTNTGNINTKLVYSLLSLGIFYSNDLVEVLNKLLTNNYDLTESTLDVSISRDANVKLDVLLNILPDIKSANLDKIVAVIGNIPVLKPLRNEKATMVPESSIQSFITNTFKIEKGATTDLLKRIISTFSFSKTDEVSSNIVQGFVGNPIMYIRFFWIDIKAMRLNYSRDRIRLLENRILELNQNVDGLPTDKVVKAIKHYEELVTKHQYKIERLSKVY